MTKVEATRLFREVYPDCYKDVRGDYCKVQFAWSCFVDGLCKDGQITQNQYDNWTMPFGRRNKQ